MIPIIQKSAKAPIPYSSGAEKFHEKFKFIAYNKKCYKRTKLFQTLHSKNRLNIIFAPLLCLWNVKFMERASGEAKSNIEFEIKLRKR